MMSSFFVSEGDAVQAKCKNESEPEVHKPLKKVKARVVVDVSNGELSVVLKESSKSVNMHGPSMHGVRPIASNGVTGRDIDGVVATSPIIRDHGKDTRSSVLKEDKDLKQSTDRLKVCLTLIILIDPSIHSLKLFS